MEDDLVQQSLLSRSDISLCPLSLDSCVETRKCNYKLGKGVCVGGSNLLFLCHTMHERDHIFAAFGFLPGFLSERL